MPEELNTAPAGAPETPPALAQAEPNYPEWADTPDLGGYYLIAEDADGDWLQDLKLTKEEYNSLKCHLAGLRGLPWPEDAE